MTQDQNQPRPILVKEMKFKGSDNRAVADKLETFKDIRKSLTKDSKTIGISMPDEKIDKMARLFGFIDKDGSQLSLTEIKRWKELNVLRMNNVTGDRELTIFIPIFDESELNSSDHPKIEDILYMISLYDNKIL